MPRRVENALKYVHESRKTHVDALKILAKDDFPKNVGIDYGDVTWHADAIHEYDYVIDVLREYQRKLRGK